MHKCSICQTSTNQPVCAKCLRGILLDLNELSHLLPRLESVARREEHVGGRSEGHSHPAFAPTLLDLSAADLLTEATDTLEDIAANAGIWQHGRTWRTLLKSLINRRQQLAANPHVVSDRERLTRLLQRVNYRLTPPSERIFIGSCLNPACGAELSITGVQETAACMVCGSVWQVEAVRAKRREKLSNRTLEATPAEAAAWIKRTTGLYVSRKNVNNWVQREPASALTLESGRHEFTLDWLLQHAESMKPRPGLEHRC